MDRKDVRPTIMTRCWTAHCWRRVERIGKMFSIAVLTCRNRRAPTGKSVSKRTGSKRSSRRREGICASPSTRGLENRNLSPPTRRCSLSKNSLKYRTLDNRSSTAAAVFSWLAKTLISKKRSAEHAVSSFKSPATTRSTRRADEDALNE
jgi:hypothetical protein